MVCMVHTVSIWRYLYSDGGPRAATEPAMHSGFTCLQTTTLFQAGVLWLGSKRMRGGLRNIQNYL